MRKIKGLSVFRLIFGLIVFTPGAVYADCTSPAGVEADIVYSSAQNVHMYCNGTAWIAMGVLNPSAGGGGCATATMGVKPEGYFFYNLDYHVYQYCDGDDWKAMSGLGGGGGVCDAPDAFDFTDQINVAVSTQIESNIVQISGIASSQSVTISGDGSPQYRICTDGTSDANCDGSVVQNWTGSSVNISNNQYLQLRLTSNASYSTMNSATVTVGGVNEQWDVTTAPFCPGSGLVGHWKFDDGSGGTATDSSGQGHDGTLSGPSWTTGKLGGALDFAEGDTDYVHVAHDFASTDVSFAFWIDRHTMAGMGHIVNKYESQSDGWGVRAHQTEYWLQIYDDTANLDGQIYGTNIGSGWRYVVATIESNEQKLYVDGSLIGSGTNTSGTFSGITGDFYIGQRGNGSYFDGVIDDVRIYDRALTQGEIDDLYNSGAGCEE